MNAALATLLATAGAAIVIMVVAWFGGKLIVALLRRLARRTKSTYDGGLVEAVGSQVGWLIAAGVFGVAAAWLDFLGETGRWLFEEAAFFLFIFALAEGSRKGLDYTLDHYVETRGESIDLQMANELVPLAKRLGSLMVYGIGALAVAGHFGVNVVAVSAALGLSGFAVALALKDTITNLFSGLVLMISRPVAIGERINIPILDVWGDVTDIGIRSSTVVTRDNRTVIVPNSQVVNNAVTNYSRPDTSYRLQTDIGLDTNLDMRKAQEKIRSEVRAVEGVLPDRPVDVWFTGFGEYSNTVRVRWWVSSYAEKRASSDAVNNAIIDVTKREGIGMPDPRFTLGGGLTFEPARSPGSSGASSDDTVST